MSIIEAQRRMSNMGAIRLGYKRDTGKVDRNGQPILAPEKLSTFRVTTPRREVADAVARLYGGQVKPWAGPKGPEFEVFTSSVALPVLVPRQNIDPNYEQWGRNVKQRFCDGATEKIRDMPCLCEQWNNHDHKFYRGTCSTCGLDQQWEGQEHQHEYVVGECAICGCHRPCKPTTRLTVMIDGVPDVGVFKIESHGWNAAVELPYLADVINGIDKPLIGILALRPEKRIRIVQVKGVETTRVFEFFVPELRFPWMTPEMIYASSYQLEAEVRAQIARSDPRMALTSGPATTEPDPDPDGALTEADIAHLAASCETLDQVRGLWKHAQDLKIGSRDLGSLLTARGKAIKDSEDAGKQIFDAEIIE
jgi:hypothetical protein